VKFAIRSPLAQPLKPQPRGRGLLRPLLGRAIPQRHAAMALAPDKSPKQCTLDQIEQKSAKLLTLLG
jgi:hypothetical protein